MSDPIDTAGNRLALVSPFCCWCLGPTDTGGNCANCDSTVPCVTLNEFKSEVVLGLENIRAERDALAALYREAVEALESMVEKWAHHSGLCCTFADGKVVVTKQSCVCDPMHQRARAVLAKARAAGEEPKPE